jgi:gluconokinase
MHGLMALDAQLHPLTPLLTWADARASEQSERLRADERGRALHRRTGTPVHSMSPLAKLIWFREHEPDLHGRARCWVGIKELALARLAGACAVDHSVASGTGLFNLKELDWDEEALSLAGVAPVAAGAGSAAPGEGAAGGSRAGIGNGAATAANWPLLTALIPPEKTGVFAGLKAAAESVAIPLSVVVAAEVFLPRFGYRGIFAMLAVNIILALVLLLRFVRVSPAAEPLSAEPLAV